MCYRYFDVLELGTFRCHVLNNIVICILILIQSEQVDSSVTLLTVCDRFLVIFLSLLGKFKYSNFK